jgi:hypothetical protein
LELLRGKDAPEFTLRIQVIAGRWFVSLADAKIAGDPGQGEGNSFEEAWHDIKPYWAD